MLWILLILGATLFVAYANGANDNFKGVATLFGSGATDYRKALWWATATTLAGSLAAAFIATQLISVFQGHGLIPTSLADSHPFVAAVILSAAFTVFVAAKMGIPISTTHSLTGAMVGSGFIAVGSGIGFGTLLKSFFLPLLVSPLIAIVGALVAYPLLIRGLRFAGLTKENCICIGNEMVPERVTPTGYGTTQTSTGLRVLVEEQTVCDQQFAGTIAGVNAQSIIDAAHFLSAGAVSFARGLNDTPKIVALGLLASALDLGWSITFIALTMALGGLLSAKKVAETVSKRITAMDSDQGFIANLVTSFLVIFASNWGLPVSTTHVSCGALFGIGIANGQARWPVIRTILLAWLLTLPIAGVTAGMISTGYCRG
jgi:PiT family inorganic phosphate transporter